MPEEVRVSVDEDLCAGCGECVEGCPVDVFEIQGKKVSVINEQMCGECRYCEAVCPSGAVSVERVEK